MAWKIQVPPDPATNMRLTMDPVTEAFAGVWVDTSGYDKFSIHIEKSGSGTISAQVFKSNKPAPLTSDDGIQHGGDISASAWVEIKVPVRNIMVKVPTCQAGCQVSAWIEAV